VQEAISIFEEAFPGVQALFFFDHSSAHATLPEDSLKAFEMNKKDGGRQRVQCDTIFPNNCPNISMQGQVQKMTLSQFFRVSASNVGHVTHHMIICPPGLHNLVM
jgi:hypothetical protein